MKKCTSSQRLNIEFVANYSIWMVSLRPLANMCRAIWSTSKSMQMATFLASLMWHIIHFIAWPLQRLSERKSQPIICITRWIVIQHILSVKRTPYCKNVGLSGYATSLLWISKFNPKTHKLMNVDWYQCKKVSTEDFWFDRYRKHIIRYKLKKVLKYVVLMRKRQILLEKGEISRNVE